MRTPGLLLLAALVALAVPAEAQVTRMGDVAPVDGQHHGALPNRLAGEVGVVEKLGDTVPGDLTFLDERGDTALLGDLLDGERPLALVFVYHSCPMLCSLVLDGVADAVATSGLALGDDYQVLAVSVDPRDTPARADSAKARYVRLAEVADTDAFHFWTVDEAHADNVKTLAEAVGFRYAFDVRTGEFAHNAALILLSPQGKVTRYLYGIDYPPRDFKLGVVEASQGTVGTAMDRFLITCYEYDEEAQGYSLAVLSLVKWGGGLLLLTFGGLMFFLWRLESRRRGDWADAITDPAPAH